MISLNNLLISLFLLFLLSCENVNYNKYISNKDFFKTTNINNNKAISQYNYNFTYAASEKYEINSDLDDFVVHHKSLPIPSVLKLANPNNLNEYEIVRNIFINSDSDLFEISESLKDKLLLNSNIYVEYLKLESKNLKNVELSKKTSAIDLSVNEIITEEILDKPTEISGKLEINDEKISKITSLNSEGDKTMFIYVDTYAKYSDAKIKTNKIISLNITISSENDSFEVLAGPFRTIDIDERLGFLLNNGFNNAKIYR